MIMLADFPSVLIVLISTLLVLAAFGGALCFGIKKLIEFIDRLDGGQRYARLQEQKLDRIIKLLEKNNAG